MTNPVRMRYAREQSIREFVPVGAADRITTRWPCICQSAILATSMLSYDGCGGGPLYHR